MTAPAHDERGRVIGTAHDFQGWCSLPADHDGSHACPRRDITETSCGYAVALIGDLTNWRPTGLIA